jgi:RNA polymerase sigma-70 factor (ECF subfamily)
MALDAVADRRLHGLGAGRPAAVTAGHVPYGLVRAPVVDGRRELVERARQGDQQAFGELTRDVADRLYGIAYRILRDPDRARDALQRTLVAIWDDLPSLRDPDRFDAWTYRLAVRASYREARQERRQARVRTISLTSPPSRDPASEVAERDELAWAFTRLSPEHRAILVLRFYLDLSLPQISQTLGIPEGTVASRLHYAIERMRSVLEPGTRQDVSPKVVT